MQEFDFVVIGAGSGANILDVAVDHGLKTALIEESAIGGTCWNRGCIPSKMLIHAADVAETIKNSEKFGIKAKIESIDFEKIVSTVFDGLIDKKAADMEKGMREWKEITFIKGRAKFVGEKTLEVNGEQIKAKQIVIAAGTRPMVPPIPGLKDVDYLTSDEALRLRKQPKKLIVIGGGYIGCELSHFFGSLGTEVTIVERGDHLLPNEDAEISDAFTKVFSEKHRVLLNHVAAKVEKKGNEFIVTATDVNGKEKQIKGDQLLVAVGRIPNSDVLQVDKTGVTTNKRGYIETDDFLETNVKGIWALGDIAGKYLFKHSANLDARYISHNAFTEKEKRKVDYTAMPHAVFSSPQVAGVGFTEAQLKEQNAHFRVGKHYYKQTGMGKALKDETGFVKLLIDKNSGKFLGCHIIGTDASTLIHEVIVAMKNGLTASDLARAIHIHPALSEVVQRAV